MCLVFHGINTTNDTFEFSHIKCKKSLKITYKIRKT